MKYKNIYRNCSKTRTCSKECAIDHGCFPEFVDIDTDTPYDVVSVNIPDDKIKELFMNEEEFYEFYETMPNAIIKLRNKRFKDNYYITIKQAIEEVIR